MPIVGRKYEVDKLQKAYLSAEAEFVAIYGRRRVGKTYLVEALFQDKDCIYFQTTGVHKGEAATQLAKFKSELTRTFYQNREGINLEKLNNWHDAFQALTDAIELFAADKRVVLFFDELPWMATRKSGLLEALDYYWNRFWSKNTMLKLIICGSAASWIIENIIEDTGGLHNRVTLRLPVDPFNLRETKYYLKSRGVNYSDQDVLTLYMCLGGIPFYLRGVDRSLSVIQNINALCFQRKGTLYDEFNLLFSSLFKNHEVHEKLIRIISQKRYGISRVEIEKKLNYKGGRLTKRLRELEEAGFIEPFTHWEKNRGIFYKTIDEYSLFYLTWIAPKASRRIAKDIDEEYWQSMATKPAWVAWSGYAFEAVCFKHVKQIKTALKIPSGSDIYAWSYSGEKGKGISGAQIDLVFDRPDGVVSLCEVKYCQKPFGLTKDYSARLIEREEIYRKVTGIQKSIFHSLIVAGGLKETLYSKGLIASFATIEGLMES